jgi:hypothetical protein
MHVNKTRSIIFGRKWLKEVSSLGYHKMTHFVVHTVRLMHVIY